MKDWQKKKIADLIKAEGKDVALKAVENLKKLGPTKFWEKHEFEEAKRYVKEFQRR